MIIRFIKGHMFSELRIGKKLGWGWGNTQTYIIEEREDEKLWSFCCALGIIRVTLQRRQWTDLQTELDIWAGMKNILYMSRKFK